MSIAPGPARRLSILRLAKPTKSEQQFFKEAYFPRSDGGGGGPWFSAKRCTVFTHDRLVG